MVDLATMPERLRPHAFRPGNNANPKGRPKGSSITAELRKLLDRPYGRGDKTIAEAIAWAIVRKALKGNIQACKLILDRTEGKVPRRVVLEREEDDAPEILIKWLEDWRRVAEVRARADRDGHRAGSTGPT